ncbi:MAG: hypothetical protein M3Q78_11260 [Acidobacteriota bacterium]|nr:hypothetical protein [Acidobacteriota bacterium]
MSNKTITKNRAFVILLTLFCFIFSACHSVSSTNGGKVNKSTEDVSTNYEKPQVVGKIESGEITESSGIAASKCQENVFWTHNDSGDDAFIFALNQKGKKLGTWKVSGAKNKDWEDIATFQDAKNGKCLLYIGDIGNNERLKSEMTIYRVAEPTISDADKDSSRKNPSQTENAEAIKFVYPEMRHDAETLLVHPNSGDIYILSKRLSGASGVYKLAADFSLEKTNTLKKIADFSVPAVPNGFLTGGDISPDGKRVVVCDYFSAYEIVLPKNAKSFDEIWTEKPLIVELGERNQGEAVAYSADGKSIFATSEKKNSPIIQVKRK